ncbi:cupin domain-containing protein [Mycolicibacterium austroafricanum]|nr:cupin domain-containing protein [Mycolicibacterium austroafricanum]QZT71135.1 cupin domain-containing protein [Mycolicibacterium austroafricanum]
MLPPNSVVHATGLDLTREPVPAEQAVRGDPRTGSATLADFLGVEVGVWEMTPGVGTDVEVDEVFIVLSGAATIEFGDATPALHVGPGDVVRLAAGAETVWTVAETLRKIYLTG